MLMVGCDSSRSSESTQLESWTQRSTPSVFFTVLSEVLAARSRTIRSCAAVSGLAFSKKPSTAGV